MSSHCRHPSCKKYATFNFRLLKKRLFCKQHAKTGMVSNHRGTRTCNQCSTDASYNYEGLKQRLYCKAHASKGMIDIGIKRCTTPGCLVSISNRQYKGKCRECFDLDNPNMTVFRNIKVKENSMSRFIKNTRCWPNAIYDKQIMGGRSSFRPDVFIDGPKHAVIIECDENQHAHVRLIEAKREVQLQVDAKKPIVVIRFNPDRYGCRGDIVESCFKTDIDGRVHVRSQKEWNSRLNCLVKEIDKQIKRVPTKKITVLRLFFSDKS